MAKRKKVTKRSTPKKKPIKKAVSRSVSQASSSPKKSSVRPLRDHILIEPMKHEEKTETGIILPDTAEKERPEQGVVVAVGSGRINEHGARVPMEVKEGDRVLFSKYGPNELKVNGKEYLVAKEEDILAILE